MHEDFKKNCVSFCTCYLNSIHLVPSAVRIFHHTKLLLKKKSSKQSASKALKLGLVMWRLTLSSLIHLHNCQFAWQQSLSVVVKPMKEK